tara:strand:+ start:1776 stop:2237 length:462 start_codon:yes stop_codon:yes gene_type:complete
VRDDANDAVEGFSTNATARSFGVERAGRRDDATTRSRTGSRERRVTLRLGEGETSDRREVPRARRVRVARERRIRTITFLFAVFASSRGTSAVASRAWARVESRESRMWEALRRGRCGPRRRFRRSRAGVEDGAVARGGAHTIACDRRARAPR